MKVLKINSRLLPLAAAMLIVLAGCASPPGGRTPQQAAAERVLGEGIELYEQGEFDAAITKLGRSPELASAPVPLQVKALKYTAFSYCVTRRASLCRAQFDKALKLDPTFELNPGERGHPLWGPVFARAAKSLRGSAKQ